MPNIRLVRLRRDGEGFEAAEGDGIAELDAGGGGVGVGEAEFGKALGETPGL